LSDKYLSETSEKIISTQANFEAAIQKIVNNENLDPEEQRK
jgi:hypothetical protein